MAKARKHRDRSGVRARKRLLVPIDFSAASRSALRHALSVVEREPGPITLLHVISRAETPGDHQREAEAKARLRDLISQETDGSDHAIHALVQRGTPFQEILAAAEELPIGMIILGVDEPGDLNPISLGHTAERVLRYASCPVLLVRPEDAAAAVPSKKPGSLGKGIS